MNLVRIHRFGAAFLFRQNYNGVFSFRSVNYELVPYNLNAFGICFLLKFVACFACREGRRFKNVKFYKLTPLQGVLCHSDKLVGYAAFAYLIQRRNFICKAAQICALSYFSPFFCYILFKQFIIYYPFLSSFSTAEKTVRLRRRSINPLNLPHLMPQKAPCFWMT